MSGLFSKPTTPADGIRLLALDGGGVRGLSSLVILKQLMERLNPASPPKPCEYFDLIGGTSTGGLIALMLGRLQMSIDEAIQAYEDLSPKIFEKQRHRVSVWGKVQGRFSHEELEDAVKRMMSKLKMDGKSLLKDERSSACRTFVCAMSGETKQTVVLSSYYSESRGTDLWNQAMIWQCARATSAASSFFDPITIAGEEFADGATAGDNNPIQALVSEAREIWGGDDDWRLEDNVRCLVSIGTGVPSITDFGHDPFRIAGSLIKIATDCDKRHEEFETNNPAMCKVGDSRQYYRFSVNRGLGDIGLEEADKLNGIKSRTRAYCLAPEVKRLLRCCFLRLNRPQTLETITHTPLVPTILRTSCSTTSTPEESIPPTPTPSGSQDATNIWAPGGQTHQLAVPDRPSFTQNNLNVTFHATPYSSHSHEDIKNDTVRRMLATHGPHDGPPVMIPPSTPASPTSKPAMDHGYDSSEYESHGPSPKARLAENPSSNAQRTTQKLPRERKRASSGPAIMFGEKRRKVQFEAPDMSRDNSSSGYASFSESEEEYFDPSSGPPPPPQRHFPTKRIALCTWRTFQILLACWLVISGGRDLYERNKRPEKADLDQECRPLNIYAIIGRTGVGKSTFIGALGGKDGDGREPEVCHGLQSCTSTLGFYKATLNERSICILDSPGFDDDRPDFTDEEIMRRIFFKLADDYGGDKLIKGLVYMHDISQSRFGGLALRHFTLFEKLCGADNFEHVVLVTSKWLKSPTVNEEQQELLREHDLINTYWKNMTARGSQVERFDGSPESARQILGVLQRKPRLVKLQEPPASKSAESAATSRVFRDAVTRLQIVAHFTEPYIASLPEHLEMRMTMLLDMLRSVGDYVAGLILLGMLIVVTYLVAGLLFPSSK